MPYANFFYGNYPSIKEVHGDWRNWISFFKEDAEAAFKVAWLHHQNRNKHHWQYWLLVNDSSSKEFVIQEPGCGYQLYLSRNNRHLAMFDKSILWKEDIVIPETGMNDNAYLYAKEIRDRLNKSPVVIKMPDKYVKEMLADWIGAGMAIHGKNDVKSWYKANKDNMILHPETRQWIEQHI